MRKEAIWSKMPVGDPNLPGQLTEQDITGGMEDDTAYGQRGESHLDNAILYYTYDYDYNENMATNIKPILSVDNRYGSHISDTSELGMLVESNEDQIRNDIEHFEEDAKIERQPGYGQPEYDPVDQYDDIGF